MATQRLNPQELEVSFSEEPAFPGVLNPRRILLQTLAANPEEAAGYLTRIGYVAIVEDGRVYAARPGETGMKALDPKGADRGDIADLADEILGGIVTGIGMAGGALSGAVGGPPGVAGGTVLGGALASGASESARQMAGNLAGVNLRPDVGAVQGATLGGAAAGPLGKAAGGVLGGGLQAARWTGSKLSNLIKNALAKTAGVSEADFTLATRSPEVARQLISEKAPRAIEVLDRMQAFIAHRRGSKLPEYKKAQAILERPEVREVPLRRTVAELTKDIKATGSKERAAEDELRKIALDLARNYGGLDPRTGAPSLIEARAARVKAGTAEEIKRKLSGLVDWGPQRPQHQSLVNRRLKAAEFRIRRDVARSIPDKARRGTFRELMASTSAKLRPLEKLEEKVGERQGGAENVLRRIFKEGRTRERQLVEEVERQYPGQNFLEDLKTASVAEAFSKDSPRLLTTGGFLGTGTGMALGSAGARMLGIPPELGAAAGGIAGFVAASPKAAIRYGRGLERLGQFGETTARGIEKFAGHPATEMAGITAARQFDPSSLFESPSESFSIQIEGDDEEAEAVRAIAQEIGQRGDLTPEQKLDEITRRANVLQGATP